MDLKSWVVVQGGRVFLYLLALVLAFLCGYGARPFVEVKLPERRGEAFSWQAIPLSSREFILLFQNFLLFCRRENGRWKIEDVYRVVRDPQRIPQNPEDKNLHGFYLDSLSLPIRRRLARLVEKFETLGEQEQREKAFQVAESIARLGGFSELLVYLSPKEPQVLREAAALALGRRGYKLAVPFLLEYLEELEDESKRKDLLAILRDLTGLSLSPPPPGRSWEEVIRKVKIWWKNTGSRQ